MNRVAVLRVDTPPGGNATPIRTPGGQPAEVGDVVDEAEREPDDDVDDDQRCRPGRRSARPRRSSIGRWSRDATNRTPNSPKIAPDAPTPASAWPEGERGDRSAGGGDEIEEHHPDRPVDLLDERPADVQRVHVEPEVHEREDRLVGSPPWTSVTVQSRQNSPCGDRRLVELQRVVDQRRRRIERIAVSETAIVIPRIAYVASGRTLPRPRAK